MLFNIFRPVVIISYYYNLTASIIQHDRFHNERRRQAKDPHSYHPETTVNQDLERDVSRAKGNQSMLRGFIDDLKHMQDYNQHNLIFFFQNIVCLSGALFYTALFSFLPIDRDPLTNEYENPLLRFTELVQFPNFLTKSKKTFIFNQLLALLLSQYLFLRIRSFMVQFKLAKSNRYRYRKMNIVEINQSYAAQIYSSLLGWLKLTFDFNQHKCQLPGPLIRERRLAQKNTNPKLRELSQIYSSYFINAIDFDSCFAGWGIQVGLKGRQDCQPLNYPKKTYDSQRDEFEQILELKLERNNYFIAEPAHRMDLPDLGAMLRIYLFASFSVLCVMIMGLIAYLNIGFSDQDCSDLLSCFTDIMLVSPKLIFGTVGATIIVLNIGLNAYDNGSLAYYSLLCSSRTNKVIKMIERENRFHSYHIARFWLSEEKFRENLWKDASTLELLSRFNLGSCFRANPDYRALEALAKQPRDLFPPNNEGAESNEYERYHSANLFESKASQYRINRINHNQLEDFNANIDYLVDLVQILQNELDDLKKRLTIQMNLNIFFGSLATAVVFALLTSTISASEFMLTSALGVLSFFPMVYSLFMAATSERSVSNLGNLAIFSLLALTNIADRRSPAEYSSGTSIVAWYPS